jgi:predicted flap endonuclease-1-like 5' DNA nuclease
MGLAEEMRELTQQCLDSHDQRVAGVIQIQRDTASLLTADTSARKTMSRDQRKRLSAEAAALRAEAAAVLAEDVATRKTMARDLRKRLVADAATMRAEAAAVLAQDGTARRSMSRDLHKRLTADAATMRAAAAALLVADASARQTMARDLHQRMAADAATLHSSVAAKRGELQAELGAAQGIWNDFSQVMSRRRGAAAPKPAPHKPKPAAQENLTGLPGLGPATQSRLAAAGITSFAGLAGCSQAELRAIVGKGRQDLAGWIKQARQRAGGK